MPLQPRVTVVIPCRNDADFLEPCLTALRAQTHAPDRILVVDNASTDATADVARRFGADVVTESMVGIWPAAARGYDEAMDSAEIIARVDADSRPHPDWIARIVRAFVHDPHLGVLTGGAEFYDGGRLTNYFGSHWYIGGGTYWVEKITGVPLVFGSNFAMRTAVWARVRDRVDRTNPDIHDDLDLTIRLRPSDGVRYDPALRMPVSARPFATPAALGQRLYKVIPTFAVSWPEGARWLRQDDAAGDRSPVTGWEGDEPEPRAQDA
ncbi:glycosyltransferase family 2 protein [Microbacterium luticocti]|uniref:glycosyltransferase family 2 protein n=1 Tax=Microbacterium luticocti TaxID=451764 RepID=UPI0004052C96|nr:glycosyltransferase family 2 protein [Microbacterium luticocti]